MSGITAGALTLIGAVTILNLVLTLAVIRRLRGLSTTQASSTSEGDVLPAAGSTVGRLAQADLSTGRRTVIMLTPSCPPCKEMLADLEADGSFPESLVCVVGSGDDWQPTAGRLPGYHVVPITEEQAETVFRVRGFPAVLSIEDGVVTRAAHELPVKV
jgi:thiol-disulfide isomerase/thioredoxin